MRQSAIPFLFMRGGTSRGPFFKRSDLPSDRDRLTDVLVDVIGSGHPLNIDGIGGGSSVTTKVAMLSPSESPDADIDYLFAQVSVADRLVDYRPTCGNMLSAVGPAAIEMGLFPARDGETLVRIRAVNNDELIEALIQTPGGEVRYDGAAAIDGVPGTAAPVMLKFMRIVGCETGALLPTGKPRDRVDGVEVSCVDVAMPVCIARAGELGLTGYESREELNALRPFFERMERIRREAGRRMGMGDVSDSVEPKFALIAPPRQGGSFAARYFTPRECHPTVAVTGAQCLAATALIPGSVAEGLVSAVDAPVTMSIEHPMGHLDVELEFTRSAEGIAIHSAKELRTARLLARGELFVPCHAEAA
ncbi:4-oxalomesaconate tautomerase [Planctomycetes bacterium Pan216]|uniref:4-oxalomesaconate tautomerase n=1 Tax=Kolteria novifilia TaxID=2527975 RepID=A0A518BAH0_9BACT|nr:4-oxalomesaconate tautomerase [Planctomycetes bacterium Pan216]